MSHIETAAAYADAGHNVFVITKTREDALAVMDALAAALPDAKYIRTNGDEAIRTPSRGVIRTATTRSLDRLRGHTATVALVAPKYVHMHPGVAEAISWLTATATDPVVLLHNHKGD